VTHGQRIVRPDSAFSLTRSKTRRPRIQERRHLDFIRSLSCCICGTHKQVEAAHVRMKSLAHGKPETGMQAKPDDRWSVPLCRDHHQDLPDAQHKIGEAAFWKKHGVDPFLLSLSLWGATGNEEAAEEILRQTRREKIVT
jgi:hypothetical protein